MTLAEPGVSAELLRSEERTCNAGLHNLPYYGFGWLMWPEADGADGVAEGVVCLSWWSYWRTLLTGLRTAQPTRRPTLRTRRWHRAHVDVVGPVQVDGEVVDGGAFDVLVEPRAMQVLVPPRRRFREGHVRAGSGLNCSR